MVKNMYFDIPPNASSMIQSLRSIGYDLDTAMADLIDNSITAEATEIDITIKLNPDLKVFIRDNGNGMSKKELKQAMVLGSKSPLLNREKNDLGRFGLGLKTASFSQCKKLSVITKKDSLISAFQWDLDFVTQNNEWWLTELTSKDVTNLLASNQFFEEESGTVVIWESCDRLLDGETINEDHILKKFEDTEWHLGLLFHRFLDRSVRKVNNVSITINNRAIEFVDPFFTRHPATQEHQEEYINYKNKKIKVKGFTLPHHSKCSKEEYDKHAFRQGYRENQGFYVYRENRLLIYGTWFRLFKKTDLTALARVQVDLPNDFDNEWHIDIKKSHAVPPKDFKTQLSSYIDKYISGSKRVYNGKGYRDVTVTTPLWQKQIDKNLSSFCINMDYPFFSSFRKSLTVEQTTNFNQILKLIEKSLPLDQIYVDYASDPKSFKATNTDTDLEQLAEERLANNDFDINSLAELLNNTKPFSSYTKSWRDFLENLRTNDDC